MIAFEDVIKDLVEIAYQHIVYVDLERACMLGGHLQAGRHNAPLTSRSSTSVPRRPSHHILRRRFSAEFQLNGNDVIGQWS